MIQAPSTGGGGPAPPSSLDPETIPSLRHYFDARTIAVADGTTLDNANFNQTLGDNINPLAGITFAEDALDGVAGADAARFSGAGGMKWFNSEPSSSWSLAMLFQCSSEVDTYVIDRSMSSRFIVIPHLSSQGEAAVFDGTTIHGLGVALDDGVAHLVAVVADGAASSMDVWVDGIKILDAVSYVPSSWSSGVHVGSQNNGTSSAYTGFVGAGWWFDDVLSDADVADVTQYVRGDWGLAL